MAASGRGRAAALQTKQKQKLTFAPFQISPLTKEEAGTYECRAANAKGDASAVGEIRLVADIRDVKVEVIEVKEGKRRAGAAAAAETPPPGTDPAAQDKAPKGY